MRRRLLPWMMVIAYTVIVVVWVGAEKRTGRDSFPPYSTFDTSDSGLSLAAAWLRDSGRSVTALTLPISAAVASDAVVFRVGPWSRPPPGFVPAGDADDAGDAGDNEDVAAEEEMETDADEGADGGTEPSHEEEGDSASSPAAAPGSARLLSDGEDAWVRRGGRLILAIEERYGPVSPVPMPGPATIFKVFPVWPAVDVFDVQVPRGLKPESDRYHSLVAVSANDGAIAAPVIAYRRHGRGEIFLISCPELLQNEQLAKGDHLALLSILAGKDRPVMFDEWCHGIVANTGVTGLLLDWQLGPSLLLVALASLAALIRGRIPLGCPRRDRLPDRSATADLVSSVGRLYARALRRGEAISHYHRCLVRAVAAESGLSGRALEDRVRRLLGRQRPPTTRRDLPRGEFIAWLDRINDAFRRLEHGRRH